MENNLFICNTYTHTRAFYSESKRACICFSCWQNMSFLKFWFLPWTAPISMPIKQNEIELHLVTESYSAKFFLYLVSFRIGTQLLHSVDLCAHPSDAPHPLLDLKSLQRPQNKVLLGMHKDDFQTRFHYSNKPVRVITPLWKKETLAGTTCVGFFLCNNGRRIKAKIKNYAKGNWISH